MKLKTMTCPECLETCYISENDLGEVASQSAGDLTLVRPETDLKIWIRGEKMCEECRQAKEA